jgi:hypothetical protein
LRLVSDQSFAANAVRLRLDALAYNLGNFLRTLATVLRASTAGPLPAQTRQRSPEGLKPLRRLAPAR